MNAILIKNKAGVLNLTYNPLDSENEFYDVRYTLSLREDSGIGKILYDLTPYNRESHWVTGYENQLGIIVSDSSSSKFSGHFDLVLNLNKLDGEVFEEISREYLKHSIKTIVDRFVLLGFILEDQQELCKV